VGYLFSPERLHEIGRRAVGLPHEQMVRSVTEDLARAYPGHIETREEWILSIAGGVMGIMTVLHASLTEYVLIFGTPIGSEGFSGRYRIDIWDVVLAGDMWTYTEEEFREPQKYGPGDLAYLRRGQAKGVKLFDGNWLLEYGRGPIVTALPFAVMTAMDARTIWKTVAIYTRHVVRELVRGKI
jgi:ERG2 and Sigma1 receptor like protein